jgi:cytochrome c oxidase assembly protein subunit 15
MLTIVLAAWLWKAENRRWMRWLGVTALGAVVAQGVLGGLTVLFFLPPAVSTAHAGLAEIFFCLTVSIALFTSPRWIAGYGRTADDPAGVDDRMLRRVATATTALIFVQILIGGWMRHTGAGLAIPTFPLAWGHLIPDHWDPKIAIHFAHRTGAVIVTLFIVATASHVWYHERNRRELTRPVTLLLGLVAVQITLGALTVLSKRDVGINSAHVVCGALTFATSLVVTLRSWRYRFATPGARAAYDRAIGASAAVRPAAPAPPARPASPALPAQKGARA